MEELHKEIDDLKREKKNQEAKIKKAIVYVFLSEIYKKIKDSIKKLPKKDISKTFPKIKELKDQLTSRIGSLDSKKNGFQADLK